MAIDQTVAEKWLHFDFSRRRPGVQYHTHEQTKIKYGVENLTFIGTICREYAFGSKKRKAEF